MTRSSKETVRQVPYYVGQAKVAYIVAQTGGNPEHRRTYGTKGTGRAASLPSAEFVASLEVEEVLPDYNDPATGLQQLSRAREVIEPQLIPPTHPTLETRDWIRTEGIATFAILSRDSGSDGTEVATWFVEAAHPELNRGLWIILTGTAENLSERWTGQGVRSRSGSGTGTAFDLLRQHAAGENPADLTTDAEFFQAAESMRGMVGTRHRIEFVAEVLQILTWPESTMVTDDPDGYPIVRMIIASPLEVSRCRPIIATAPEVVVEPRSVREWLRGLFEWFGLTNSR